MAWVGSQLPCSKVGCGGTYTLNMLGRQRQRDPGVAVYLASFMPVSKGGGNEREEGFKLDSAWGMNPCLTCGMHAYKPIHKCHSHSCPKTEHQFLYSQTEKTPHFGLFFVTILLSRAAIQIHLNHYYNTQKDETADVNFYPLDSLIVQLNSIKFDFIINRYQMFSLGSQRVSFCLCFF